MVCFDPVGYLVSCVESVYLLYSLDKFLIYLQDNDITTCTELIPGQN